MARTGQRRLTQIVFWLAVIAAGWFAFAPTAIGGYDSYVLTDGTSMLPTIHGGGLVVTRSEHNYHVGEVVAYHNAQLGNHIILHRITAIKNGHYTFKGDNNASSDLYPPLKSKLVGRKWLYWPGGGRFFRNIQTPYVGAIIFGLFGMWAFADIGKKTTPRRRRRHHAAA